jgi:hypothetical protein
MLPSISSSWYQGSIIDGAALKRGKAFGNQIVGDRRRHVVDMARTVLLETDTLDASGGLFDDANSQRLPGATRATTSSRRSSTYDPNGALHAKETQRRWPVE